MLGRNKQYENYFQCFQFERVELIQSLNKQLEFYHVENILNLIQFNQDFKAKKNRDKTGNFAQLLSFYQHVTLIA